MLALATTDFISTCRDLFTTSIEGAVTCADASVGQSCE